jgi:hypothetical protein
MSLFLEIGIAQHRLWRHVLAYGAHTCMLIPLEGIITKALYCSRTAMDGVDDVVYSI